MVRNGEGQSPHVLVSCVNFEVHISVLVANYSCSFELVVGEKIIRSDYSAENIFLP